MLFKGKMHTKDQKRPKSPSYETAEELAEAPNFGTMLRGIMLLRLL